MSPLLDPAQSPPLSTWVKLTLLSWLAMIGVDFLLHAGLLASWYVEPHPFLLPPTAAFARIPLGYMSFLGLAVLAAGTGSLVRAGQCAGDLWRPAYHLSGAGPQRAPGSGIAIANTDLSWINPRRAD